MDKMPYIGLTVVALGFILLWLARAYFSWRAMKDDDNIYSATRQSYITYLKMVRWLLVVIGFILMNW